MFVDMMLKAGWRSDTRAFISNQLALHFPFYLSIIFSNFMRVIHNPFLLMLIIFCCLQISEIHLFIYLLICNIMGWRASPCSLTGLDLDI